MKKYKKMKYAMYLFLTLLTLGACSTNGKMEADGDVIEQFEGNEDSHMSSVEEAEEAFSNEDDENMNKRDIELVKEDINQYISKLKVPLTLYGIPLFSSVDELSLDDVAAFAVRLLADECEYQKELFSLDEVENKSKQLFGSSYEINKESFDYQDQVGVWWNYELNQFELIGIGMPEEWRGKVINVEENGDGYEAEIIYFQTSYWTDGGYGEMREQPLLIQNNKVIGHIEVDSDGEEEYIFYDSLEELTRHKQQFKYESDEQLIWTRCEIINEFIPASNFTAELAVQYVYDYFNVTEENVYIDIRTDVPYDNDMFKYHYFRWYNIPQEGAELGGTGGPTMWVSNYGQVYKDMGNPGDYYLRYDPEIKFSIKD